MKRAFLIFLFTVLPLAHADENESAATSAQEAASPSVELASQPEPKIVYEEDPTLLVTSIDFTFVSGASDDPAGKTGLANLVSELLLRGTKKRTRSAFQSELERLGATLEVHTTHDSVSVLGSVIKENTLPFLALVQDCLLHPRFGGGDFANLKTELLADIAHWKNSNNRLSGLAMRKTLFEGTALEHPSDGSLSTVKAISLKDVQAGYRRIFNQGNVFFGVSSPLKQADLQNVLVLIHRGLPKGARAKRNSITPKVPAQPTLVVVNKPKTSTGALMFGQAGIDVHDKYRYTLAVANFSFGAEPLVSRLFRIVRGELGYTYAIGSSYGALGALSNQQGLFTISSTPAVEFTTKTVQKTLALWREYQAKGLDSDELGLAHESMVNSYPFEFDSADKRLAERMYGEIYGVPVLSPTDYKKTIDAIGKDDIRNALREKQSSDGWVITIVADADEIAKQLEAEQKDVPAEKRLKISKTLTPDQVVE